MLGLTPLKASILPEHRAASLWNGCYANVKISAHLKIKDWTLLLSCHIKRAVWKWPSSVSSIAFADHCRDPVCCFHQQIRCHSWSNLCCWILCSSHQFLCPGYLICHGGSWAFSPSPILFWKSFVPVCIPHPWKSELIYKLWLFLLLFPVLIDFVFH